MVHPMIVARKANELMSLSAVRASMLLYVNFFFKYFLLRNYLNDFDEISQKCSCHGPLYNFLKEFDFLTRGP